MKIPSDDLFLLIKSLSKSEKRYFKLYLDKGSPYLFVFDEIDKQKEYDERLLVQKIRKHIASENIKNIKAHLLKIILKCLDQYSSETLFESGFKNQFKYIYILQDKGLFDLCRKHIQKLKAELKLYERYTDLVELSKVGRMFPGNSKEEVEQMYVTEKEATEKIVAETSLRALAHEIFKTIEVFQRARERKTIKKIEDFLNDPLLNENNIPGSFRAAYYYYDAICLCQHILGHEEQAYLYRKSQVKLFEKNPQQTKQYPQSYILVLAHSLIACFHTGRLSEAEKYLKELKALQIKYNKAGNVRVATNLLWSITNLEISMLSYSGNFNKIILLISDLENKMKQEGQLGTGYKIDLSYSISYAYFGLGNYSQALMWINKIINHPKIEIRSDIQVHARILWMLIHYEMENYDFLENSKRSVYRFLNKKGRLFKYESIILDFIRKVYTIQDQKKKVQLFKMAKDQLLVLKQDPLEKYAFEDFDIISWLDSKINERPFAELVREKSKTKF